jgi:putative acetyltransferase
MQGYSMTRNDRVDVTLSPMTACDLEAVLDLWGQTEGVGLNESDTPKQLRAFLDRNSGLSVIARDGPRLIGAVLCGHDGRRGYLHHLAVLPNYRGRGLGRQMAETCLAALGALGILKCNIFLYADNEPGERFWRQCGWSARSDLKVLQRKTSPQGPA